MTIRSGTSFARMWEGGKEYDYRQQKHCEVSVF